MPRLFPLFASEASPNRELSAVIKVAETLKFLPLGRFETLGSNLRYGISKEVATVRIT